MSSGTLQEIVVKELIRLGDQAKEKLALRSDVSVSTIRNIEIGRLPRRKVAYKIARACGLQDEDALLIARVCSVQGQRTA